MDYKEKFKIIEDIIEEDSKNGRHVQKQVKDKFTKNGLCPVKFLNELFENKRLKSSE